MTTLVDRVTLHASAGKGGKSVIQIFGSKDKASDARASLATRH